MDIDDIRLNVEELDDAMYNPPTTIRNEWLSPQQEARHIANTATDKANSKWIEAISAYELTFNMYPNTQYPLVVGTVVIQPLQWQSLKKLAGEE